MRNCLDFVKATKSMIQVIVSEDEQEELKRALAKKEAEVAQLMEVMDRCEKRIMGEEC
jgi:hypothetical protein